MEKRQQRRGERKGQAVEKQPPGVAEREAARVAGRQPLDARTGAPMKDPDEGRMERPDLGRDTDNPERQGLSASGDDEDESGR